MKCPNCEEEKRQHKVGKTTAGSQRYRCYACRTSYTPEKKSQGYSAQVRQKAIRHYVDGSGFRRTAQLGVSQQSVGVKEHAESLPPAAVPHQVKPLSLMKSSPLLATKKQNLSNHSGGSSHPLYFELESGLGKVASLDSVDGG
jgi:hypothetical protein